jgi:uncharacterized protein YndB with AHSA1/START domain
MKQGPVRLLEMKKRLDVSPKRVWAVLADFPNIADWNRAVTRSVATSEATRGVGAKRHCELAGGALEETVTAWEEGKRMEIRVDSAARLPIARGLVTFTLTGAEAATEISVEYGYEPRFGVVGQLMGRLALDKQLKKGFAAFLRDLEAAAQAA